MPSASDVHAFANLFAGRTDVLGHGHGEVTREQVLVGTYAPHLEGEGSGIGIFPLRDDGTVRFAAIDLDEPNFELARDFQMFLPGTTWIERSRSGNAHVWAFFSSACPAWVARGLMKNATESLGRKDVEIFPKQDTLAEGMVGNYINLPYHGDDRPMMDFAERGEHGNYAIPLDDFISAAQVSRINPDAWQRRAEALGIVPPEKREVSDTEFGSQPFLHDCAAYIYKNREDNPIQPGGRAAVLFHVAVQFLNYDGFETEEVRGFIDEINDAMPAPLDKREVDRIFRNAASGRYRYTGCDDPLMLEYVHPECPFAFPKN